MATIIHPPKTLLEVYQSLPEGTMCQLINNQLIMSPSPLDVHQKVLDRLYRRIGNFVEKNNLGETRVAPYDVYFNDQNAYQPDIVFVATENLYKIRKNGLHGSPDLVIEILSPGTSRYDLNEKKHVYEQCEVKEYLIVDPTERTATSYCYTDGKFVATEQPEGYLYSQLLQTGFNY